MAEMKKVVVEQTATVQIETGCITIVGAVLTVKVAHSLVSDPLLLVTMQRYFFPLSPTTAGRGTL